MLATQVWQHCGSEAPAVSLTVFDLGEFDGMNRSLSVPQLADETPPQESPVSLTTTFLFRQAKVARACR